jgi:hypothetical protein
MKVFVNSMAVEEAINNIDPFCNPEDCKHVFEEY